MSPARRRNVVWLVPLLATMMVQAVLSANLFAFPVVALQAAAEMRVDPSWIGLYSAVVFGCSILSSLAAGAPVRRWGAVRTGQLCLLTGAVAALLAASSWLPLVIVAAVCLGVAFGPATPAASELLLRVTKPRERPLIFSIKEAGIQLGGITAGLIFPVLVVAFDWRAAFVAVAAASFVGAALLEPLRKTYDVDRDPNARLRFGSLGRALELVVGRPSLRALGVAGFCFSALQQCLSTFLVVDLVRNLGQPLKVAGIALAVVQVAGIVARIGFGAAANRMLSVRWLLVISGAVMTASSLGLVAAQRSWSEVAILAVCALFGLSATGWQGIYLAEVARLAPANRATDATGGILAAAYGGLLAGPLMFGLVVRSGYAYAAGFFAMAVLSLLGTCLLALVPFDRRRDGGLAQTNPDSFGLASSNE